MANTLKPVGVTQITTSFTTVYTVPAVTTFTVAQVHFCNTSNAAVTLQVCLTATSGTTADATNALMYDFSIASNDVLELLKGDMWAAGYTLKVKASANNVVNIKLSGIETA